MQDPPFSGGRGAKSMALLRGAKGVALDVVAGALAFVAFYVILHWAPDNNASVTFLIAETIYFVAGLFLGGSGLRYLVRVLLIVAPGAGTILVLAYTGYAFTAQFYLICFFVAAFFGTASGAMLCWLFGAKKTGLVSLTTAGILAVNFFAVRSVIPRIVAESLSKDADLLAPSFTFSSMNGAVVSSDQLHGRVVLLAFWATWCRPCIGELPRVEQVYRRYRNDPRVAIWVVDSGISNDTVEKQRRMIAAEHWDLPFAHDSENLEYKMGFHGLPKLVLLDKTGRVRWLHDGFDASEDLAGQLTSRIDRLLGSG
jgi:thiol-disulfide isomerase/thioredoxin